MRTAIFVGDREKYPHLFNKSAIIRRGKWPDKVLAQFDAMHLKEAFGWHEFDLKDFVNQEGSWR